MSEKQIEDGGPAFPCEVRGFRIEGLAEAERFKVTGTFKGLSIRDHFAGLAMQAMVRNNQGIAEWGPERDALIANGAYEIADAMLAARKETR